MVLLRPVLPERSFAVAVTEEARGWQWLGWSRKFSSDFFVRLPLLMVLNLNADLPSVTPAIRAAPSCYRRTLVPSWSNFLIAPTTI
jgi:hypothetical protein